MNINVIKSAWRRMYRPTPSWSERNLPVISATPRRWNHVERSLDKWERRRLAAATRSQRTLQEVLDSHTRGHSILCPGALKLVRETLAGI